jgi:hypothetical protein
MFLIFLAKDLGRGTSTPNSKWDVIINLIALKRTTKGSELRN